MAKVYVTKYAISRGIEEIEREIYEVRDYDYSYIKYNFHTFLYIGKDAFLDKSEAIKKAEEMKKRKIASLRKQIEKLEKMTFWYEESSIKHSSDAAFAGTWIEYKWCKYALSVFTYSKMTTERITSILTITEEYVLNICNVV